MEKVDLLEFENIFACHLDRYPKMQAEDIYKLLYQSAFGVGHFLKDKKVAFDYLLREMESCDKDEKPKFEKIGNGFIRLNISRFSPYDASWIIEEMEKSCEIIGDKSDFFQMLEISKEVLKKRGFDLSPLETLVKKAEELDLPPIHHSEIFRTLYHPAYRVLKFRKELEEKL